MLYLRQVSTSTTFRKVCVVWSGGPFYRNVSTTQCGFPFGKIVQELPTRSLVNPHDTGSDLPPMRARIVGIAETMLEAEEFFEGRQTYRSRVRALDKQRLLTRGHLCNCLDMAWPPVASPCFSEHAVAPAVSAPLPSRPFRHTLGMSESGLTITQTCSFLTLTALNEPRVPCQRHIGTTYRHCCLGQGTGGGGGGAAWGLGGGWRRCCVRLPITLLALFCVDVSNFDPLLFLLFV